MYYAETNDVWEAIEEEKRIKAGSRLKKVKMIESMNPSWEDLAAPWYDWFRHYEPSITLGSLLIIYDVLFYHCLFILAPVIANVMKQPR